MELVTAVAGPHHASCQFQLWGIAGGAHHQQLEPIVENCWVVALPTGPLVELDHCLMAAGVEKLGDTALPLSEFPLHGLDALLRNSGDGNSVACGDGHLTG